MIELNELIIPAARKGNLEVLQELISQKADVNKRDEKGYTPLIIAWKLLNSYWDQARM